MSPLLMEKVIRNQMLFFFDLFTSLQRRRNQKESEKGATVEIGISSGFLSYTARVVERGRKLQVVAR